MPATLHTTPRINTCINGWPECGAIKAAMKFVDLAAELYSAGDIWNNSARTVLSVIKLVFWCLRSNSLTVSHCQLRYIKWQKFSSFKTRQRQLFYFDIMKICINMSKEICNKITNISEKRHLISMQHRLKKKQTSNDIYLIV